MECSTFREQISKTGNSFIVLNCLLVETKGCLFHGYSMVQIYKIDRRNADKIYDILPKESVEHFNFMLATFWKIFCNSRLNNNLKVKTLLNH